MGEKMVLFDIPSIITSFLNIGVWAGTVAAFYSLIVCTTRHLPVAFGTLNVGELLGEVDFITWPAVKRSVKNLSITSTCFTKQFPLLHDTVFKPGLCLISCRVPLSFGNSHGTYLVSRYQIRSKSYTKDLNETASIIENYIARIRFFSSKILWSIDELLKTRSF